MANKFDVYNINPLVFSNPNLLLNTSTDYKLGPSNSTDYLYGKIYTELVPGESYVFSFSAGLSGGTNQSGGVSCRVFDRNITRQLADIIINADGTRQSFYFTIPSTLTDNQTLILYAGVSGNTKGVTATYHHMKLEKGTISTDWVPAKEDIQGNFLYTIEGIQDEQNYVPVTVDNLTPNTAYDNLMIVHAGEDISNSVPLPTITTSLTNV